MFDIWSGGKGKGGVDLRLALAGILADVILPLIYIYIHILETKLTGPRKHLRSIGVTASLASPCKPSTVTKAQESVRIAYLSLSFLITCLAYAPSSRPVALKRY